MSYFQSFHFSILSFPEAFFSKTPVFPNSLFFEFFISKFFIFDFLFSKKFFFEKCSLSRIFALWNSYFQNFHFSIFSFPEAFFLQNAAFPEFCTLECLISKVLIFRFLASQKLFFCKTLNFGSSAFCKVLFPKF